MMLFTAQTEDKWRHYSLILWTNTKHDYSVSFALCVMFFVFKHMWMWTTNCAYNFENKELNSLYYNVNINSLPILLMYNKVMK